MSTQMLGPSVSRMGLPEDDLRRSQLRKKLDEYRFRLKMPLYDHTDTAYKIAILDKLLAQGVVDPVALAAELAADRTTTFDHGRFYGAFAVIESYCRDGGATAMGGTGLPDPE